jgi:hypothetical protein
MPAASCNQPEMQQIQDAISDLTAAFTEFRATQDHRYEANLLSIQTLQTQLFELKTQSPTLLHQVQPHTPIIIITSKPQNSPYHHLTVRIRWTGCFKQTSFSPIITSPHTIASLTLLVT